MSKNKSFLVLAAASTIVLGAEPALAMSEVELLYAEVNTWLPPLHKGSALGSTLGFADTNELYADPMLAELDLDAFALESMGDPLVSLFPPMRRSYFEIAVSDPFYAGTVTVHIPTSIYSCAAKHATVRGDGRALYTAYCYFGDARVSVRHDDALGQTHWDDNGGLGHATSFAAGPSMPAGGVFHHGVPRSSGTTMEGAAVLESLPPDATVTVVYSRDDWATATKHPAVVSATGFVGNPPGYRYGTNPAIDGTTVHSFSIPDVTSKISYYFVVESSLGSFTDDNQGMYYGFEL
ncbi:hypothetical protein [Polyangium jinanense]|uniref:Uncharacterized protein n=1 Tax=Polyangium jinanense TaxID=2829994 RepID=A0A9X3XDZ2_9BACT|nr:hypothetical protein [Polyangium jinanense]MDC3962182.1 hypothetical protein [Polyangium jinanense]MDC3988869.1 hypothetical protein [Polyangium jinanense]